MPLVRVRHTQPNGRVRWLESVIPADETDVMVWSTDPASAAVFDLPSALRKDVLERLEERVGRGKVELIEAETGMNGCRALLEPDVVSDGRDEAQR